MKAKPKPNQYSTFQHALKKVLSVSHEEMRAKLEAEHKAKAKRKGSNRDSKKGS